MEMRIKHCHTEMMLGDFFTKPLQGALFCDMRDVVQWVKSYKVLEEQWKKKEKKTLEENNISKVKEGILKVTIDRKECVVETRKTKDK